MSKKKKIILISVGTILGIGLIGLIIYLYPMAYRFFNNKEIIDKFKAFIDSCGVFGVLVMIAMMMIQLVIAFIPGEPFELMAGVMYGWFGGLLISLFAAFIGSSIIFLLVRKLGHKITDKFFSEEKMSKYKFLNTAHNRNKLLFIIFLIPGTPKDLLTYVAPLTPIKYKDYIFITTIARIPSIISSTLAGGSLIDGDVHITLIIYAVTFALTIIGVLIDNHIQKAKKEETN